MTAPHNSAVAQSNANDVLISANPARNYEVLGEVPVSSVADIKAKAEKARAAQAAWQALGIEGRVEHIRSLIEVLKSNRDEFVRRTSQEMGMPIALSQNIVDGAISEIEWNCDHAVQYLAEEVLFDGQNETNTLVYEPYGVMACIVAWNFPLGNFAASASQALLAGNTVVMKYSEEVPLFEQYLESVIEQSGLPDGVVNFVYGGGDVGALLAGQHVDLLSFTGSSQTGRKIYQKAAEKLIPVVLELGGSSPGVVFADCDLNDKLIEKIFWKRFLNSAQFCDGLKRLIVHNSLVAECAEKLAAYAETVKIGDPLDVETKLGPLVAERQVKKLEEQIKDAVDKGAKALCGGKRPDGLKGAYYEPTILSDITRDMRVWKEEVFGPALPVVGFDTYDEAIELANDTDYGLSGFVYTNDRELALRAMRDIKAGVLDDGIGSFYKPENPFGGYKQSGIGRQGGKAGFHQFCQKKVIAQAK